MNIVKMTCIRALAAAQVPGAIVHDCFTGQSDGDLHPGLLDAAAVFC